MLAVYVWILKAASPHFIFKTRIPYHCQHAVAWILRVGYPWVIIYFRNRQHIHAAEQKDTSSLKVSLDLQKHTVVMLWKRVFWGCDSPNHLLTTWPPLSFFFLTRAAQWFIMQLPGPITLRPTNSLLGYEFPLNYDLTKYKLFDFVVLFKIGITHFLGYLEHTSPFPGEPKSLHLSRWGNTQRAHNYENMTLSGILSFSPSSLCEGRDEGKVGTGSS